MESKLRSLAASTKTNVRQTAIAQAIYKPLYGWGKIFESDSQPSFLDAYILPLITIAQGCLTVRNTFAWCQFYSEGCKNKTFVQNGLQREASVEIIFDLLNGCVGLGLIASGIYSFYSGNIAFCLLGLAVNAAMELSGSYLFVEAGKQHKKDNRPYALGFMPKFTSCIGWAMLAAGYQEAGFYVLGITSLIDIVDIPLSAHLMARRTAKPGIK